MATFSSGERRGNKMSQKTLIDLYFDVISPYSRIAFESLLRYEKTWPIQVNLIPFFLGGVMKGTGNKPPLLVPAKLTYMNNDLQRNSDYWGIKCVLPKDPVETMLNRGSILAQRFITAIDLHNKNYVETVARELWTRVWERSETIHNVDDLKMVAAKVKLPDVDVLIAACGSTFVKNTLKERTEAAVKQGCFGAPWIVVHRGEREECFFGSDRMHLIAHSIGCTFDGPQPLCSKV